MHLFVAVAGTPIETTLDLAGVLGQAWQPAPFAAELSLVLGLLLVLVVTIGASERLFRRARRDQLRSAARPSAAATPPLPVATPQPR
jgi:hypothetical protein